MIHGLSEEKKRLGKIFYNLERKSKNFQTKSCCNGMPSVRNCKIIYSIKFAFKTHAKGNKKLFCPLTVYICISEYANDSSARRIH